MYLLCSDGITERSGSTGNVTLLKVVHGGDIDVNAQASVTLSGLFAWFGKVSTIERLARLVTFTLVAGLDFQPL